MGQSLSELVEIRHSSFKASAGAAPGRAARGPPRLASSVRGSAGRPLALRRCLRVSAGEPQAPLQTRAQAATVAQSAYAWSCQVSAVATTSFALLFQWTPSESGKFSVIETMGAPLP